MYYCDRCDRDFSNLHAFNQHEDNSTRHNICHDCDIDFESWIGLKEHWVQSPYHAYCQYCRIHFDDEQDLDIHYEDYHPYCASCRKVFVNEYGLEEHFRQSPIHHYCQPCDRHFQNANNLNAHLNSAVHRPKDVKCPFGCGRAFISRADVFLHLEGGACSSGINRRVVDQYVRQYDRNGIITDPSRLLTGGTMDSQEVTYIATGASWNGRGYECYLCHKVHSSLPALNQHLSSPRHQDKVYICRGPSCGSRFAALSALVQHIESGRCDVSKFKVVHATMDSLLGQVGRLTWEG